MLPNPVGYNRVYVLVGDDFSCDNWWSGQKAGRSFVTNGPLLVTKANDHLPGHVFKANEGEAVDVNIDVTLTTLDDVSEIEIIRNGRVKQRVPVEELQETSEHTRTGRLGRFGLRTAVGF